MGLILSNEQFLTYHDWRWVGKNMLDTNPGTPASLSDLLDTNSIAGARLAEFIEVAEGMLFAATSIGDRYSVQDVVTYGGALARKIVADLAVMPVLSRRDRAVSDLDKLSAAVNWAQGYLQQLRDGERIFALVPNVPEAGLPDTASQAPIPGIDPPRWTQRASRYFGGPSGPCCDGGGYNRLGGFA